MPDLTGIPWGQVGWGGIAILVVLAIIRGDLVPRKIHEDLRADRDQLRAANDELLAQNSQLIRGTQLSVNAMQSVAARVADQADEGAAS